MKENWNFDLSIEHFRILEIWTDYQVGVHIEGEFNGTQISVLDGDWDKYYLCLDSMELDSNYVSEDSMVKVTPRWQRYDCCPESNSESVFGGNKRLKAEYWWESGFKWVNPDKFIPILELNARGESDKRGAFGIWICHKRYWKLNWDLEWTHIPFGAGNTTNLY